MKKQNTKNKQGNVNSKNKKIVKKEVKVESDSIVKSQRTWKDTLLNVFDKVKKFIVKNSKLLLIILAILVIIIIIYFLFFNKKGSRFALSEVYDVYPEEIRELYTSFVDVSCTGDIHFDIPIDKGAVTVEEMKNEDLLNYLFSYLDKNGLLTDNFDDGIIKSAEKELFEKRPNLTSKVDTFSYGEYTYDLSGGKIKRTKRECPESEVEHVTYLYGYFWDENSLSIDINVGYLKEGILYTYDDKKLGEYDGDLTKLSTLMETASYYRANYVRYGQSKYKLSSVEWKHKS